MGWKVAPTQHGAGRFGRAGVGTNKLSSTGSHENGGAGIYLSCPSAGGSCRTSFLILQGEPTSESLTALRWADAAQRPATPYHAGGSKGTCVWSADPAVVGTPPHGVLTRRRRAPFIPGSPGECDAWIVFDMAFDRDMNAAEHGALSRQVSMCVAANRRARRPFRLAAISTNEEDDAAVNPTDFHDESVESRSKSPFVVDNADVANPARGPNAWRRLPWTRWGARCGGPKTWQTFDPTRVVYLTADAEDTLDTIRDGDVLVLGGLVDHREKPGMALDRAVDYGVAPVRWRTARLPLGGHVRLLKNAHLPCLAVCQLLLLARQLTPRGDQGVAALNDALDRGVASATKKVGGKGRRGRRRKDGEEEGGAELGEREKGGELEGGAMRGVWNAAIASCPAFRCAPLHKYVVWLPPHDALNDERRGGARARPSGVTDVRAFEFVLNGK